MAQPPPQPSDLEKLHILWLASQNQKRDRARFWGIGIALVSLVVSLFSYLSQQSTLVPTYPNNGVLQVVAPATSHGTVQTDDLDGLQTFLDAHTGEKIRLDIAVEPSIWVAGDGVSPPPDTEVDPLAADQLVHTTSAALYLGNGKRKDCEGGQPCPDGTILWNDVEVGVAFDGRVYKSGIVIYITENEDFASHIGGDENTVTLKGFFYNQGRVAQSKDLLITAYALDPIPAP